MAGRHRFSDLIEQLSAERRERVDRIADESGAEIDPEQLSEAASAKVPHNE